MKSASRMTRFTFLAACIAAISMGCQPSTADLDKQSSSKDSTKSEKLRIAFVTNQPANFWNIAKTGAEDAGNELSEEGREVEVIVRIPAKNDASLQKQIIEDLIASKIDGLAVSPVDKDLVPTINDWASKVNLITHDSDSPDSNRLLYIGMDNYAAGRMAGKMLLNALPNGGKVALFVGQLEQDNATLRRQGVIDVLMGNEEFSGTLTPADAEIKNEKFEIVGTYLDQGKPNICLQKAEDALSKYSDLAAVVGLFEYNPPELMQAVEKRDKLGQIVIVGFDENDKTLQGIKDGTVVGTVVQNPYQYGYKSVEVLTALARGDKSAIPESKYIDFPAREITKENVDPFWDEKKSYLTR